MWGFPHNDELESSMMVECGLGYLERAELDDVDLDERSSESYEAKS